ncbi:MAG: hypothetical protein MRY57_03600 [Candidatus Pacebacteria bacterium]|nr:hypothetical protein [Candidatus Paceibacterota bacterium]
MFTQSKQKFNNNTLCVVSSTHEGKLFHLDKNTSQFVDDISVELLPYPEKHGQLSKTSPSGNLQKTGMVYERDNEEEIAEYITLVSEKIQDFVKNNDEDIYHLIIMAPASIHKNFQSKILDTLHNIHLKDIYLIDGNYLKIPFDETLSILDGKDFEQNLIASEIK